MILGSSRLLGNARILRPLITAYLHLHSAIKSLGRASHLDDSARSAPRIGINARIDCHFTKTSPATTPTLNIGSSVSVATIPGSPLPNKKTAGRLRTTSACLRKGPFKMSLGLFSAGLLGAQRKSHHLGYTGIATRKNAGQLFQAVSSLPHNHGGEHKEVQVWICKAGDTQIWGLCLPRGCGA